MSSHYVSVLLTFLRKKSLRVWYMSFPFQSKLSSSLLSVREMCIPKTGVSSPTCLPAPFLFRPLRWFHDCPFGYLLVCRKFEQFLLESSDLMFSTFLRQTNFLFIFASVSRIFSVFVATSLWYSSHWVRDSPPETQLPSSTHCFLRELIDHLNGDSLLTERQDNFH